MGEVIFYLPSLSGNTMENEINLRFLLILM